MGKAEDLATTVILASNKDILLVPAMNVRMWLHKATQNNLKTLLDFGYKFIGPISGEMACGEYGEGKMSSPRQIFSYLKNYFDNKDLVKKKKFSALVTTGPTREYIDPVDIAVCAAAVADFKPKNKNKQKIKKDDQNLNSLDLEKNKDILEYLGKNNKLRPKLVVGFSAETENLIKNSTQKLNQKYCDMIIANDVSKKETGFNVDYNKISIIEKNGKIENIHKNTKSYIAAKIAKKIIDKLLVNDQNSN